MNRVLVILTLMLAATIGCVLALDPCVTTILALAKAGVKAHMAFAWAILPALLPFVAYYVYSLSACLRRN
ncbi:MAG: hypothetical protein AAF074_05610 [Pseudomonadota bacterium]